MLNKQWIVGLDLSAPSGQLALLHAGDPQTTMQEQLPRHPRNSATLLPVLEHLCTAVDINLEQIRAVGVAIGPGSFTGLRISLATAKGLAVGLGCPLYGIPSLKALAWEALSQLGQEEPLPRWVVPFRDAHRGELFTALFGPCRFRPNHGNECIALPQQGPDRVLSPDAFSIPKDGLTLLVGESQNLPRHLHNMLDTTRVRHIKLSTAALSVAKLAFDAARKGLPAVPSDQAPNYGRKPQAEVQWSHHPSA